MGLRCSQCALVVINSIFALIGLALFIFGCLIKFGSENIEDYIMDKVSGTLTFMRSAGSDGNMVNFDLGEYLGTCAFVLIGVGAFFLVVSILGCCGSIGKIRCFLVFYAIVLGTLILVEIAIVITVLAFPEKVREVIKEPMYKSLQDDYRGINSSDVISVGWNFMMVVFECCGVENFGDFRLAGQWENSREGLPLLATPIACCKSEGTFPQVTLPEPDDIRCAISPTESNSNMEKGCVDALIQYVKDHYIYIVIGAGVIVLSEVVMLLMVICLLLAIKRRRNFDKELQRMFRDD